MTGAPAGTNFKQGQPTRYDRKAEKAKAEAEHERQVYAQVNARDRYTCRVCGAAADPKAVGVLNRGHHHHVVYRSAGGPTETWNIALLCARCHNAEHHHDLDVEGNADVALTMLRKDDAGQWYIVRQELAPHVVEKD